MIYGFRLFGALGLAAACLFSGAAMAGAIEDIKAKGVLVVGTKADYPPYGFLDSSGKIVGLEPDMAADVAKRLGVKLELVPTVASNRMQFLQQGKIDLMISTMSVNEERKKAVGIVEPYYYASGVAILVNKAAKVQSAADLKGKPVCAIQGAFYNNRLQSEFTGQDLVAFKGVPENEAALLGGQCVGFVYDDVLLIYKKQSDAAKWKDYDVVVLKEFTPVPWGLAVKLEEKDTEWGKFMAATTVEWLKSGTLLALEKKWLGQNTEWLTNASK
ncbi:MAG: transporter substrate-binding domain-containing protein [Hyphomicrobiales bacterium]|nr:transporter substrate-binding domain-containing protein [Hyphomicrobiales bacterium]